MKNSIYSIYNPVARWILFGIDKALSLFVPLKNQTPQSFRKILVSNIAHLGDVILTTSLIPVLRSLFPNAEIGIMVGSWSKAVIENHPDLSHIHLIDHWKVSRSQGNKWIRYLKMRHGVKQELLSVNYDLAIDCNPHFPNMAFLMWSVKIPMRIGFSSAGFGSLLTHSYPWDPSNDESVVEAFFSLLKTFNPEKGLLKLSLPHHSSLPKDVIVIAMGSGNRLKNWPLDKWRKLCQLLAKDGETLLFTGLGEQENEWIHQVIQDLPRAQNLCGKLPWERFVQLVQQSKLLVATDSSAGHVAAAVGTPSILIFTGIHPPNLWKPFSDRAVCLVNPIPCSPCFTGCSTMDCIREISVERVYSEIRKKC